MQSYTLCDLDNNQTRCYPDCRYQSSPSDHAHHHYVTSVLSPIDENSTTSGYDNNAVVDNEFWQLCDADRIAAISSDPLDFTYYFRYPDYEYASEQCYADDPLSAKDAGSWNHENCRRTFYTDSEWFTGSWGSVRDDVILDSGYADGYLSVHDGTDLEYMEMLSNGQRQRTWNDSEVTVPEDGQGTGSSYGAPTGNSNRLMRGVETFKWMTVRRASSKYAQTGLCDSVYLNLYSVV